MPKLLAHSDGSGGPCIDRQNSARDPTSLVPGQESDTSSCVVVVVVVRKGRVKRLPVVPI